MPIKEKSFINDLLTQRNSVSGGRVRRNSRNSSAPAWRNKLVTQDEKDSKQGRFRRDHTCIWSDDIPQKRHARRLSSSRVGLSGASPAYVEMRGPSPTREQKCKDQIAMSLEMGSIEDLWKIYVQSSAWHQDDGAKWPIQNLEFVKVRKRLTFLIKRKMRMALENDSAADMEDAIRAADGKVQILAVQGNDRFPDLDQIFERLESKQEEQRRVMKGLTESSSPKMAFHDKGTAKSSLQQAVDTKDIEEIRRAIQKCMEGRLDVTEALGHVAVTSKYFAREGERAKSLFPEGCFKGEGRCVHIVNLGPEMDLGCLERHGTIAGVKVKCYTDPAAVLVGKENRKTKSRKGTSVAASLNGKEMVFACEVLENPHLHTIIIISGPEPARLEGDTATLTKLVKFNKAGGALGIIGSGNRGGNTFPLIRDANLLLQVLGYDKMWGHDAAARVLHRQSAPSSSGFNAAHPLFSQMRELDEGFSITGLDEMYLKRGFRELIRSSNGKLLSCIKEPSASFSGDGSGPIFIHGSPTQLLCSKEAAGAEQWVNNVALYLTLRQADVDEAYAP